MDDLDLPTIPPDLGFVFKNHTIERLHELWNCSRRTMTKRLSKFRDLLGVRIGQEYSADQVIIMCMIWEPPEAYYHAFKFMETHGWTKFIAMKYKLEKLLDHNEREKLIKERSKNKSTKGRTK